ncbi:hypothetical protein F5148DRAFT_1368485 [Russula earlei]|uniref:Uncharacterized protein n=1 Tax=Russula earlei TaxID=71964 RepID=A0ACC0U7I1_9AGAM|nr:hypothetical protein F5148DRAFT_1368485 [Russula earlei]
MQTLSRCDNSNSRHCQQPSKNLYYYPKKYMWTSVFGIICLALGIAPSFAIPSGNANPESSTPQQQRIQKIRQDAYHQLVRVDNSRAKMKKSLSGIGDDKPIAKALVLKKFLEETEIPVQTLNGHVANSGITYENLRARMETLESERRRLREDLQNYMLNIWDVQPPHQGILHF